jgi:hypothetical protein
VTIITKTIFTNPLNNVFSVLFHLIKIINPLVDSASSRKELQSSEIHFTSDDADESDAQDTPTPVPSKKRFVSQIKSAAELRLDKLTPKTAVDDMIPDDEKPAVARILRISPSSDQPSTSQKPTNPHVETPSPTLTRKQRQNQKKQEKKREAKARDEAIRQSQLQAHLKDLETIRLNTQIKESEKKVAQMNVWAQGRPSMEDSVYTIRDLSDENLTTTEYRSDEAASEEGWQEVMSKAAKKAVVQKATADKGTSGTEGSEEMSSLGDSEEGFGVKVRPAFISSNSFANLDS